MIATVLALATLIVIVVATNRGNAFARRADEALIRERRNTFKFGVLPADSPAPKIRVCDGRLRQTLESGVGAESASSHERSPGSS